MILEKLKYFLSEKNLPPEEVLFFHDQFRFDHSFNPQFNLHAALSPHSQDYYNPAKAYFLSALPSFDVLNSFKYFWARDGRILLQRFFQHTPAPQSDTIIMIHVELKDLVPDKWRSQVAYYEFVFNSEIQAVPCKPRFLLLAAPLYQEYISPSELSFTLHRLTLEIGGDHLLTIPHYWITSLYSDERGPQAVERVSQYLKIINDFSQQSLKNVDWEEFIYETRPSHDGQSNACWVDLNSSKSLVADSYLLHALAHRKILPYSQQKLKTLEEISIRHLYLPLSPNHGAVIYN